MHKVQIRGACLIICSTRDAIGDGNFLALRLVEDCMEIELQGGSILILPLNAIQSYRKLLCFVGAAYTIWISLRDFGLSLRPI
jgi:hypothetical protein